MFWVKQHKHMFYISKMVYIYYKWTNINKRVLRTLQNIVFIRCKFIMIRQHIPQSRS